MMRKEDKLIFLFSRVHLENDELPQTEELLQSRLDWGYILDKSQQEGVSYLLYYHLKKPQFKNKINPDLEQLKKSYYRNSAINMMICEGVKKLLRIFNAEKVEIIILKGVFLLEHIYKNIALRPITDVDILIRKDELTRANRILNNLGWSAPLNYQGALKVDSLSAINTLVYRSNNSIKFGVHLHWHLINTNWPVDFIVDRIDMRSIWYSVEPLNIAGVDSLALSPEHLLIYLSQHSFIHSQKLILLSDIAEVIRFYNHRLDWDLVREEAERFNLLYIVYHSLFFVSRALNFEIASLGKLRPKKYNLFARILSLFISKGLRGYELSYFVYLSQYQGFLNKLRFIKKTLLPSSYVMAHRFNLNSSQIKAFHYYQRIINKLSNFFPEF